MISSSEAALTTSPLSKPNNPWCPAQGTLTVLHYVVQHPTPLDDQVHGGQSQPSSWERTCCDPSNTGPHRLTKLLHLPHGLGRELFRLRQDRSRSRRWRTSVRDPGPGSRCAADQCAQLVDRSGCVGASVEHCMTIRADRCEIVDGVDFVRLSDGRKLDGQVARSNRDAHTSRRRICQLT
jgi:hypothetical protein